MSLPSRVFYSSGSSGVALMDPGSLQLEIGGKHFDDVRDRPTST